MSGSLVYGYPQRTVELKTAGDDWEVSGHVSTWDLDLGGDVVHRGAFGDTLQSGMRVKFLFAHDPAQIVGKPLELREDDRGLFGRFALSRTRLGHDIHQLLVDGCLDAFSIGFLAREHDYDEKAKVRNLRKIELLECSLVALPMNPRATVSAVKAEEYRDPPPPAPPSPEARLAHSLVEAHLRRVRIDAGRRANGLERISWPQP